MKAWIKKGVITLAALAAFPLALYAVLGLQGRLSSPDVETLRNFPLIGQLLPPAEQPAPAVIVTDAPAPKRGGPSDPDGAEWKEAVEFDDPEGMVVALKARRDLYDQKLTDIEAERRVLERRRAELDDRENTLGRLQDRIELSQAELERGRKRLDNRSRLIDSGEAKALKSTAKMIAEMDSEKAAEAMAALDEDRAADLLYVMEASAAASILSEMKENDRRKCLIDKIAIRQSESGQTGEGK